MEPIGQRLAILSIVFVVTGCGPQSATSTSMETTTTAPPVTSTTQVQGGSTTSVPDTTTTSVLEIDVELSGGEMLGPDGFEFSLGEMVSIWVVSDIADVMHIHGYDLFYDLEAGVPIEVTFSADVPGVFEVEVHSRNGHVFDIEVAD